MGETLDLFGNKHHPDPISKAVVITPEIAKQLLSNNPNNRNMHNHNIMKIAASIKNGKYPLNGETIVVDWNGRLVDGQQRLTAVVDTGVPIRTFLVTGVDPEVMHSIDQGVARTAADTFAINGEKNSSTLAASLRLLWCKERYGDPFTSARQYRPPTINELEELFTLHPGLVDSIADIRGAYKRAASIMRSAGATAMTHYLFVNHNDDKGREFFSGFDSGVGLDKDSPILVTRDRLLDMRRGIASYPLWYRTALVFKAYRLFCRGRKSKQIRLQTEETKNRRSLWTLKG